MKYIDAEFLRKEIEFAKSIYNNPQRVVHGVADAFRQDGRAAMCDDILKKIDSLQQEQPEVDMEKITKYSRIKELPDGFEKEWLCYYHKNPEYNSAKFSHLSLIEREYIIARHFYALGVLKAS